MNKYPMCEKLESIKEQSQLCGEFLEWLQTKFFMLEKTEKFEDMCIPLGYSSYINIELLLAEFFNINREQIEKEKKQMIEEIRGL